MDTSKKGRIFSSDFLQEMKAYLTAKTEGDLCITRTQLCTDLGLDAKMDTVIGAIIKLDHMPGFKIWMGPGGGIGRVDRKSSKKDRDPGAYAPKLSDEDAKKILAGCEHLCGGGQIVPRKKIAAYVLGGDSTKKQNLISAALKLPEFDDFTTKNGKGGGVYKMSKRPELVKRAARAAAVANPTPAPAPAPSQAPADPAPAPSPVPEGEDLSAPLDTALEDQTKKLSPLEQRWASSQKELAEKSADVS